MFRWCHLTNTLLIEWKGAELTNIEEYLGPNGTKLWKVKNSNQIKIRAYEHWVNLRIRNFNRVYLRMIQRTVYQPKR
jgi:hypothetical protein